MQQSLEEVIALQAEYSDQNTLSMQRRGVLIRNVIPGEMRAIATSLREALRDFGADADAEGRDGTGRKTRIPWVRWFSRERAPSAQRGWYLVYLFHQQPAGVSLCLSHGSTSLKDGSYHKRSDEEVSELMSWAASVVGSEFDGDPTVRAGIELGSHELARAYERTTVFSKFYPARNVPNDAELVDDLQRFCEPLRKLYKAQGLGLEPGKAHPDVTALEEDVKKLIAPLRAASGQGMGLSAPLRKAVEMHAMTRAKQWLAAQGFRAKDVSVSDSCDFRAVRDGEEWIVEVKGTTGGPGSILLTRNEVALHQRSFPRNVLLVVHSIEVDRSTARTSGGELIAFEPWQLDGERLSPVCFEYRLGVA